MIAGGDPGSAGSSHGLTRRMPMIPLGTVLLPSTLLPMQLFEARYLEMISDVLAGDREFGIVLIRRGSEVGGGEERHDIGTVARVAEAIRLPGERWSVSAIGYQRIRIEEWLPDDPYPMAVVEPWPDEKEDTLLSSVIAGLITQLRRLLAGLSELDERVPVTSFKVANEACTAIFQMTALAPISVYDRQRLLEISGVQQRAKLLGDLLSEAQETVDMRLAGA